MSNINIIKGAVLGHVIGDAVGVPVEFVPRQKLERHPVYHMLSNGTHNMPKGTWSDDSSMMLCTLASIIVKQDVDFEDIMTRFSQWAKNGYMTPHGKPFGIGRTTLKSIAKFWRGESAIKCGCISEKDNGNGSLMRILPISIFNSFSNLDMDAKIKKIHMVSALTHAHDRSCIACGIYNFIFEEIVRTQNKSAISLGLEKAKEYYQSSSEIKVFERLFKTDFSVLKNSGIKSSGYVVDTLEAAVWSLLNSDNYKDAVLCAVNLGEDTDTIAAIAGGLAGALYGYDNLPREWVDDTLDKEKILLMCDDFNSML